MRDAKVNMLNSTRMILRPTTLELSRGRFMRGPEGHGEGDPAPSDPPADPPVDPIPPAADPSADPAGDPAGDPPADDKGTALGSGDTPADPDPAPAVPEKYELTPPEGFTIDQAAMDIADPVFRDIGLSNDQANKLMPVAAQWAQQIQDSANQAILAQVQADRKAWLDTAKSDPEIGGANWDKTLVDAAAALDALGLKKGSAFRNLLDESGLGNHPEMIRAFKKVNDAIGEDGFARHGDIPNGKADRLATLYPNDVPQP